MLFKDYYSSSKSTRICVACRADISNIDTVYCVKCLKTDSDSKKQLKSSRKSRGLCIQCGINPPTANSKLPKRIYVRCQQCLGYQHNIRLSRKSKDKTYSQLHRMRLKNMVIGAYGGKCSCPKCTETHQAFLTIDHINNDGHEDRVKFSSSLALYRWLVANNFPRDNYRLLCFNCNSGRDINGGICPHMEN